MASLTETTPVSIITKASLETFSVDEKNRRELAIRNKNFFYGDQTQYVKLLNSDVDAVVINLTRPVISKKANLLYSRPLKREFDGPSASVSFLESEYKKLKIDAILRNVDVLAELTGTSVLHVGLDEAGNIVLVPFDGSEFTVVSEGFDRRTIDAISIISEELHLSGNAKNPTVQKSLKTQVWTDDYITTFSNHVRKMEERNELGYIPFTSFRGEEVQSQYLGHAPATSIQMLNTIINDQLTNLGYMIKMQSATPIVVEGFSNGAGITVHPGTAIAVPAGAKVAALQLNPKIEETLKEIRYLEDKLYETSSVPKISVVGESDNENSNSNTAAESGKALLIKWYPLIQVFKEKTLRYQKYELNMANMILKVKGLEPIENVLVDWAEENLLPIHTDTENMEELFKWGITTPADMLQRRDPTLTDEEAELEINVNTTFNKSLTPEPVKMSGKEEDNKED